MIQMNKGITVVVLTLLIISTTALHLQSNVQEQIDILMSQQNQFKHRINKIIGNVGQTDQKISQTSNIDDRIVILEKAILSERQDIYNLSTVIIPPFNISKASCEKMTDQQKVTLLEDLYQARKQVNNLKNLTDNLPECDKKNFLLSDIQKQIFFMDSMESIIFTNCSVNIILSASIFQTNIYAKNWILGNLTIDDLIEQYYQRSVKYENITNCPVEYPFFNGQRCIMCTDSTPTFNISSRQCVSCGDSQHVDNDKKKCVNNIYNTNWTSLNNYQAGNQALPSPQPGSIPCPSSKPYYNGKECIACQLPKYFNVPDLECKECQTNKTFDVNTNTCKTIDTHYLTLLSGTKWVSNKTVHDVLSERAKVLELNKTSGKYHNCPTDKPYYDGVTCLSCPNEFSLDTKKCVTAPSGKAYDPNLHNYVTPETKQTNPEAKNLIGKPAPDDPNVDNCNSTHPYYDGVACINCLAPFPRFDIQTKRCVTCDGTKQYNATSHACQARPIIYISHNDTKLMATPSVSIDQYQDQVTKAMNKPGTIVLNCPNSTQYSNFTNCFTCNATQYFNVEYKICDTCVDGKVNETTKICVAKIHHVSNLSAPNFVNFPTNKSDEETKLTKVMKQYPNVVACPIATPYFNGTTCMKCDVPLYFFDYTSKKCLGCPNGTVYDNGTCSKVQFFSNTTELNNISVVETAPNNTIAKLEANFTAYKDKNLPYRICPTEDPYFNETYSSCSNCPKGSAIDLKSKQCIKCEYYDNTTKKCYQLPTFSNVTALNETKVIQNSPNYTLLNLTSQIQNYTNTTHRPYKSCPTETPYLNETNSNCSSCPEGLALDLESKQCVKCEYYNSTTKKCFTLPTFSNITALNETNYIQNSPNYTLLNLTSQIENYTNSTHRPYKVCPAETPFFNSSSSECAANCSNGMYLSLETKTCVPCDDYSTQNKTCPPPVPHYANLTNTNWTTDNSTISDIYNRTDTLKQIPGAQECPAGKEFYNNATGQCQSCPDGTYFNYDTNKCIDCNPKKYDVNVHKCLEQLANHTYQTSPNSSNLTYGGVPSNQYLDEYNANKTAYPNIQDCPKDKPYYDGINCIMCPSVAPYFSIKTRLCHACPQNSTYNAERKQCVSTQGGTVTNDPNPAKMYAGIFHMSAITRPEV